MEHSQEYADSRRACTLGIGELTLALAALTRRWQLTPATTTPVRYEKDIVIRLHNLHLHLHLQPRDRRA